MITLLSMTITVLTSCLNARAEEPSYWEIPKDIRSEAEQVEEEFQISRYLILSLVYQECRFQTDLVNGNITQITNVGWFDEGIEALQLTEPKTDYKQNMRLCAFYLNKWFAESDDIHRALRSWNEGPSGYSQPSNYSNQIINRADKWSYEVFLIEEGGNG